MTHLFRRRWIAIVIGLVAGACSGLVTGEARAQIDPYTGGIVTPAESCNPGAIEVTPGGVLSPGQEFTLGTSGQRPNSVANFYVEGVLIDSVATNAAGAASVATRAPKGLTGNFLVAVAGACGTVTALVDPQAASVLGVDLGRGFARTGFALLPLLLAAIVLIFIGRTLVRRGRNPRSRVRSRRLAGGTP